MGAVAGTMANLLNLIAIAQNVAEKFHSIDVIMFLITLIYAILFVSIDF
jgi:hypothetical protein